MKRKQLKTKKTVNAQLRSGAEHPFGAVRSYVPLGGRENELYLVASGGAYQTVYFVVIEGRQLIDDDAYRDVLALAGVDSCDKSVQNKGIKRTDDAFHLRVIGNEEVGRVLRI